ERSSAFRCSGLEEHRLANFSAISVLDGRAGPQIAKTAGQVPGMKETTRQFFLQPISDQQMHMKILCGFCRIFTKCCMTVFRTRNSFFSRGTQTNGFSQ